MLQQQLFDLDFRFLSSLSSSKSKKKKEKFQNLKKKMVVRMKAWKNRIELPLISERRVKGKLEEMDRSSSCCVALRTTWPSELRVSLNN